MTVEWLTPLSGAMFTLAVIAMAAALIIGARDRRRIQNLRSANSAAATPCAGPLARLDFFQSLDPELFAKAAEEEALAYAQLHLRDYLADATPPTLQALIQFAAKSELVVAASGAGAKALASGAAQLQRHRATGKALPVVIDSATGKSIELMKSAGVGRKLLSVTAAVATLAVSLAHIIATADLARTLADVNNKLDLLLAYRRIDQSARLERIYTQAQELLASPLDEARRMEILRLRGELRELRAIWRGEIEYHLSDVADPSKEAFVDWMFTFVATHDAKIAGKISEGRLRFMLIEYALRLDHVLAAASGTLHGLNATMAGELAAIARLEPLLAEKLEFISEKRRDDARKAFDGFSEMIRRYDELLPPERRIQVLPKQCLPGQGLPRQVSPKPT